MNFKSLFKNVWFLIVAAICMGILSYSISSGVNKVNSYILGIAQNVPDQPNGLANYHEKLKQSLKKIDGMTWEEYRQQRKEELEFEVEFIGHIRTIYRALYDRNMIGK